MKKMYRPRKKLILFLGWLLVIALFCIAAWAVGSSLTLCQKESPQTRKRSPVSHEGLPDGRVVYMKSEGIYFKRLGREEDRLLVKKGTYPRWSPDGQSVAFVQNKRIGLVSIENGRIIFLANPEHPRAVAFHPDRKAVWYTDGEAILSVDIVSKKIDKVISGKRYRELDCAKNGTLIVFTAKESLGFYVYLLDTTRGRLTKISRGCSASLSPEGTRLTVNGRKHLVLKLYDTESTRKAAEIDAPPGLKFDNQYWSNHPDWIVSVSEGEETNVYLHRVSTNRSWALTRGGGHNRPDLFIQN